MRVCWLSISRCHRQPLPHHLRVFRLLSHTPINANMFANTCFLERIIQRDKRLLPPGEAASSAFLHACRHDDAHLMHECNTNQQGLLRIGGWYVYGGVPGVWRRREIGFWDDPPLRSQLTRAASTNSRTSITSRESGQGPVTCPFLCLTYPNPPVQKLEAKTTKSKMPSSENMHTCEKREGGLETPPGWIPAIHFLVTAGKRSF